ncbi:MAG: HD-GYP domain-containing protein [Bacillota bacterium]
MSFYNSCYNYFYFCIFKVNHQQRVSRLALKIAREINLKDKKINEIRIAGLLHDLGKVKIPSEILCKPGDLEEYEFNFIKVHN